MSEQRFTTLVVSRGSRIGVVVPFDPDALWGAKARHDVSGTLAGHSIRGPLQPDRDGWILSFGPVWREQNGLNEGDEVEVVIHPEGPQLDNVPADFAEALNANTAALDYFFSIAPFYRKNYVRWIEDAKRPETRANRIAETVKLLSEGKRSK
ncbi:MAG: YdeI/OmpD-associated family protein [Armatimonas sp.]